LSSAELTKWKLHLTIWQYEIRNTQVIIHYVRSPVPHDVIATCPVCSHELSVTRLRCGACGTVIEGEFGVGRFGRLTHEQTRLLESFLRSRGNLREMERELGISYPTVRARVEALVRALGFGPRDEPDPATAAGDTAATGSDGDRAADQLDADIQAARLDVLERLARRELSAEQAAEAIRALGRTDR
jgi:hypothetical protein